MQYSLENDTVAVVGENERAARIFRYLKNRTNVIKISPFEFDSILEKKQIHFNVGILAGYGHILTRERLSFFRDHLLTCHGGILPEYRGSSPMNWALINGEQYFGISVIRTREKIDNGEVFETARFDISNNHSIKQLHIIANNHFPQLVFSSLLKLSYGIKPIPQISSQIKYYPRRDHGDACCNFYSQSAAEIFNIFRAVTEVYHDPWFFVGSEIVQIKNVVIVKDYEGTPGKVYRVKENKILVKCKLDAVEVTVDKINLFKVYMNI